MLVVAYVATEVGAVILTSDVEDVVLQCCVFLVDFDLFLQCMTCGF